MKVWCDALAAATTLSCRLAHLYSQKTRFGTGWLATLQTGTRYPVTLAYDVAHIMHWLALICKATIFQALSALRHTLVSGPSKFVV